MREARNKAVEDPFYYGNEQMRTNKKEVKKAVPTGINVWRSNALPPQNEHLGGSGELMQDEE